MKKERFGAPFSFWAMPRGLFRAFVFCVTLPPFVSIVFFIRPRGQTGRRRFMMEMLNERAAASSPSDPHLEIRSRLAGVVLIAGGLVALLFFCLALGLRA
jgi:hypothetical protein